MLNLFYEALPGLLIGFGVTIILCVLEVIYPRYNIVKTVGSRKLRNITIGVLWRVFASTLLITPVTVYFVYKFIPVWHRPDWYSGVIPFVLDFLFMDFLGYAMHYLGHKVPFLWRFHSVHHLDENVDTTTGLRDHFGEKVIDICIRVPAFVLLSIPVSTIVYYEVALFVAMAFHHSNVKIPSQLEKIIGVVFTTPKFHGVHHGRKYKYTDSNYSLVFWFWDKIFNTVSLYERPDDFEIGLDKHSDRKTIDLVVQPFIHGKPSTWTSDDKQIMKEGVSNEL